MKLSLITSLVTGATLLVLSNAFALTLGFQAITNNTVGDPEIGEAQLSLEVTEVGGNALFTFMNSGPEDSSITRIYWDDNAGVLASLLSVDDSLAGVLFGTDGATPHNLPAGNEIGFLADFSIDSNVPTQPNGVNPGEYVGALFSLAGGTVFDDLIDALLDESLVVGIHVQGFESEGSESFVTGNPPIPEPATLWLLGAGLIGAALYRRKSG